MTKALLQDFTDIFRKDKLQTLIVFVTSRCNLKCAFCCYKDSLNSGADMPLENFAKMAMSVPRLKSLLISGGEPFLRKDLGEILSLFIEHCGVRFISVSTNGYFTEQTAATVEGFLEKEKEVFLTVTVSLDGAKATHDAIRGVSGAYERAAATLDRLFRLREKYGNMRVVINTVACAANKDELESWADFVRGNFPLDYHNMELVRVGMPHLDAVPGIKEITAKFAAVYNRVSRYYTSRSTGQFYPFISSGLARFLTRAFDAQRLKIYSDLVLRGKPWPFLCLAGKTISVADADGDFRACELRPAVCRLREHDFDIAAATASPAMKKELLAIAEGKCFCTHGCFVAGSQRHYPSNFIYRFWLTLLAKGPAAR